MVTKYLLRTKHLKDEEAAKKYRVSRAFKLRPFIHTMRINHTPAPADKTNTFFIIQAKCNSSYLSGDGEVKNLLIIMHTATGDPLGGYFTCTVG